MTGQKILLPYNFTNYDKKALDFVIRMFSHLEDAEVTVFNIYMPVPELEMRGAPVMEKLKSNLSYLSQKVTEQEAGLKAAREILLKNGFSGTQVHHVFKPRKKDTATEIIDAAMSHLSDIVVLNSKPATVTRFFTGSVSSKVIAALKDTTVCVVT